MVVAASAVSTLSVPKIDEKSVIYLRIHPRFREDQMRKIDSRMFKKRSHHFPYYILLYVCSY